MGISGFLIEVSGYFAVLSGEEDIKKKDVYIISEPKHCLASVNEALLSIPSSEF